MALANFFDKSALAASQILHGFDRSSFESKLVNSIVEIAFDQDAADSFEGLATIELLSSLLARLFPKIIFSVLDTDTSNKKAQMKALVRSINPNISLEEDEPSILTVAIGATKVVRNGLVLYIGSEDWNVKFSQNTPVRSGQSSNPFAAGVAACFGAANVFRHVFAHQLGSVDLDQDFNLCLLSIEKSPNRVDSETFDIGKSPLQIPETFLVGLGAIGNGAVWAISKIPTLQGTLHLIDDEKLDLSNLQRYVLTNQGDNLKCKVEHANRYLSDSKLDIISHVSDWATFLKMRNDWNIHTVLVAVDSAASRIAIQGSLPKHIFNAWTQASDLGVSRHLDFINQACLACLYPPPKLLKSDTELIASSFGLPEDEVAIREMLYNNSPVDATWLQKIAAGKSIPIDKLHPFEGKAVWEFYQSVFCGGVILGDEGGKRVETPMAFQSAMAGILLICEFIKNQISVDTVKTIETISRIDLLRPLSDYLNEMQLKRSDNNCICQDTEFRSQYITKYNS
jgi:hypothetical protein